MTVPPTTLRMSFSFLPFTPVIFRSYQGQYSHIIFISVDLLSFSSSSIVSVSVFASVTRHYRGGSAFSSNLLYFLQCNSAGRKHLELVTSLSDFDVLSWWSFEMWPWFRYFESALLSNLEEKCFAKLIRKSVDAGKVLLSFIFNYFEATDIRFLVKSL